MKTIEDTTAVHQAWKTRFRFAVMNKNNTNLNVERVRDDRHSELGHWLHGPGKKLYGRHSEFTDLVVAHGEFQRAAASILQKGELGDWEGATKLLDSELVLRSANVIKAIVKCIKVVRAKPPKIIY